MTFSGNILRVTAVLLLAAGADRTWAINGSNAPSFFPVFFNSFNYAGSASFLLAGTSAPDDTRLLPGTVPGASEGLKLDLTVRREALEVFMRGEFYHTPWGGLQVPVAMFNINHQILSLRFGDLYSSIDPLLLANRVIRGGGMKTGFEILDDFLRLSVQFQLGRSREGSEVGDPVSGWYGVEDSLGVYPTNLGLLRINLAEGQYNTYNVAFNFLHAEDYTKNSTVDSALFPPRRSRLYGVDVNYAFPGGLADLEGRFYLSSLRENVDDADETDDVYDRAIIVSAAGRTGDYGYRTAYRYVGKHYYTGGNPYLPTDRHGARAGGTYTQAGLLQVRADAEYYRTNLDDHARTPTGNVIRGRVRASLEKRNWPRLYLQLRMKGAWTDSVLVEVVDPGMPVFAEQFRRERSSTFGAELGGNAELGKVRLSGWTGYIRYRDASHEIFPVLLKPADADHYLLGLRSRWRALPALRLDNGVSLALVRQEQAAAGYGINETSLRAYARTEYRPPAPLERSVVRAGLEYARQASDLPERDYTLVVFRLAPEYRLRSYLLFDLGYILKSVNGPEVGYTAHTLSLETVVLY